MPKTIYLTERLPQVFKVAKWLAASSTGGLLDLSRYAVLVPTSGAGRRLRFELVKAAGDSAGLLAPLVTTPMGLLALACPEKVASRTDALLAWTQVISGVSSAEYPLLLSGFSNHRSSALQIGQSLAELCSLVAEAGLTPASLDIARACSHQEDRWREIESLYRRYLERLKNAGLSDSNVVRIRAARDGLVPPNVERVIVAGLPDLNRLSQRHLENLEGAGTPVTVLVDAPDCDGAWFDNWGRPDSQAWPLGTLPLRLDDIMTAAEPSSEAEIVARLLGPNGAAGVCVADAELIPFHGRALRKRGLEPYDPAGKSLAAFECATLSNFWLSFCSSDLLTELRALAEHPVFLQALCRESQLPPSIVLSALDKVRTECLAETLKDAVAYLDEHSAVRERMPMVAALISGAQRLRSRFGEALSELPEFLRQVYAGRKVVTGCTEAEAIAALSNLLRSMLESPLSTGEFDGKVFREEMKSIAVFEGRRGIEVELNGWLEAPWLPHSALVLSGCTEGALPATLSAHPFLPDSLRVALGLHSNSQRFARDIYLLHCLLAAREPGAVKLTLCRTGADGEPAKPSRLLFRCPGAELGPRVRGVFRAGVSLRETTARERAWSLEIPERPVPTSLRVTALGDYLKCPLRFYFKHVLLMREFEAYKAEMNAIDFGNLLHRTLENFANEEAIRESSDATAIERFVLAELDALLSDRFGRRLSLPVRVQRESLRARLRRFARIQARERRNGWRIQCGELRFEEEATLRLAGLPILASLDRVDVNERSGQRRILDYKTFAKRKTASEVHFEQATGEDSCFETVVEGKAVRWLDLQLPLYRALAQLRWPDESSPQVGYFLLPERIEESCIDELALGNSLFQSAMSSAETVAERVRRGIYWPPRAVQYDDYESLFLGEDPASILSSKSKEFLMGRNLKARP
jgi:ATP-dependent helicase/nuclease subunit B